MTAYQTPQSAMTITEDDLADELNRAYLENPDGHREGLLAEARRARELLAPRYADADVERLVDALHPVLICLEWHHDEMAADEALAEAEQTLRRAMVPFVTPPEPTPEQLRMEGKEANCRHADAVLAVKAEQDARS